MNVFLYRWQGGQKFYSEETWVSLTLASWTAKISRNEVHKWCILLDKNFVASSSERSASPQR